VRRTRDAAADLRERWETSDSPLVHKLQDMGDSLRVEETETARTLAAIRSQQPDFDMHEFVAIVKRDVPPILRAYLGADVAALRAADLAPPLLERLGAMMAQWRAEGHVMDTQILDLSELEVVEIRMMRGVPVIVLQFQLQQINCVRDASGAVMEGAADDIQSVYYAWAMEQLPGSAEKPVRWRLNDLQVRGMVAIV
jgi:import inner membrane translocase subunit TIM44